MDLAEKFNYRQTFKSISKYNSKRGMVDKAGLNGSITNRSGEMGKGDIISVIDGHRIAANEEMI